MHSCHTTILLQIVYLTTNNNLTKYLSVADVSSYFAIILNIRKLAKIINFGSGTHISDAKIDPFITFGQDMFPYMKNIGVQIKEKIIGKTAVAFLLFWENTGPKIQFVNLALSITEIPEVLHILTRYTSNAVGRALLVKHFCKLCCFSSVLAMIVHACMSVKHCAAKNHAVYTTDK